MEKLVIIISLEGDKSNTEINFYTGLSQWIDGIIKGIKILCFPIGKSKKSEKRKQAIKEAIQQQFERASFKEFVDVKLFFLGDMDVIEDIQPMENAKEYCIEGVKEYLKVFECTPKIDLKIVGDVGKDFEDTFDQFIKEGKMPFKKTSLRASKSIHKKLHTPLFKEIAICANWVEKGKLIYDKILKETKGKTQHYKIFKFIFQRSKYDY